MVDEFTIVFTDLDGTFLDHDTYSHEASMKGLEILKKRRIPLVMVSSKTFDEMKIIHSDLKLNSPFIFENGGGLAFPEIIQGDYSFRTTGPDTSTLKIHLATLEKEFSCAIRFICDISLEQLIAATALPEYRARLAQMRKVSLPFLISDKKKFGNEELNLINSHIHHLGIVITKGGRFFHLMSNSFNKGTAMEDVVTHYKKIMPDAMIVTMGIGDSENDIALLEKVDKTYLVRKKDGSYISTGIKNIIITEKAGPAGFSEAILKEFDSTSLPGILPA